MISNDGRRRRISTLARPQLLRDVIVLGPDENSHTTIHRRREILRGLGRIFFAGTQKIFYVNDAPTYES